MTSMLPLISRYGTNPRRCTSVRGCLVRVDGQLDWLGVAGEELVERCSGRRVPRRRRWSRGGAAWWRVFPGTRRSVGTFSRIAVTTIITTTTAAVHHPKAIVKTAGAVAQSTKNIAIRVTETGRGTGRVKLTTTPGLVLEMNGGRMIVSTTISVNGHFEG